MLALSFFSFCFGCSHFQQHKVTELLFLHFAYIAHIFGSIKSLCSFFVFFLCYTYFWQHEVTELFLFAFCFCCTYFWQCEVTDLSFHILLQLHVLCRNTKSLRTQLFLWNSQQLIFMRFLVAPFRGILTMLNLVHECKVLMR